MNPKIQAALGHPQGPLIHRQVTFTLEAFDRFKDYQRALERTEGRRLCNSEALQCLILSHPET